MSLWGVHLSLLYALPLISVWYRPTINLRERTREARYRYGLYTYLSRKSRYRFVLFPYLFGHYTGTVIQAKQDAMVITIVTKTGLELTDRYRRLIHTAVNSEPVCANRVCLCDPLTWLDLFCITLLPNYLPFFGMYCLDISSTSRNKKYWQLFTLLYNKSLTLSLGYNANKLKA